MPVWLSAPDLCLLLAARVHDQRSTGREPLLVEVEPGSEGGRCPGLGDVVEAPEATAAVIEDAIEHHAHVARVRLVEQLAKCLVATQQRVDRVVVVGVIAVIGGRGENGREIQRRHAQVAQLVEVLGDTQQVATLVAVNGRWRLPGLHGTRLGHPVAGREPVREDLVEDRVAGPRRGIDHEPELQAAWRIARRVVLNRIRPRPSTWRRHHR